MLALPDTVSIVRLSDRIDALMIENDFARCKVSLWGAQVMSFVPKHDARERLFVSDHVKLDRSKSMRGGVPICWPWFGARQDGFQAHGYVRTQDWTLLRATETPHGTELVMAPLSCKGDGFEGNASLQVIIQVGETLSVTMTTVNTGDSPLTYHAALHTYFAVSDVNDTQLLGLSGVYSDKTRDWAMLDTPEEYRFTEETDRIHLNPTDEVFIKQANSETSIRSAGHDSWVVWNPWVEKSESMVDMDEVSYKKMLCVETAVTQGHVLEVGEMHSLSQVIS